MIITQSCPTAPLQGFAHLGSSGSGSGLVEGIHLVGQSAPQPGPAPDALLASDPRAAGQTWVVILAGDEGRRIRQYTTSEDGTAVPKQFCRFRDERTLLCTALGRALRITSAERILVMVLDAHRRWWERELQRLPGANVLSQPEDRGTAVAILQALVEIHCRDRDPRLVVMPSDADVDDEAVLLSAIAIAQKMARVFPEASSGAVTARTEG